MENGSGKGKQQRQWQLRLHELIYESETTAGKAFDITLLACIVVSIIIVMLDSVEVLHRRYGDLFFGIEWFFTIVFTIEYILRLICIRRPLRYAFSALGIIDLL